MTPGDRPRSGAFGGLPWSSAAEQDPIHARRRVACNWARGRGGAGRARPNVSRQGPAGGAPSDVSTDRLANGAMSVGLRIARSGRIPRIDPSASDGTHRVQPNGNVVGPTTTTAVEMTALETIAKIAAMTIATMTASPRVEKTERIVETAILIVALSRAGRRIRPCGTARNPARTKPSWSTVTAITAAAARGSAAPITAVR